ncbi:glycoside hydrolase family 1 protein [Kitasatospora sp. NPDC057692]|uniref:glycoside hydrolase family 1 protein n=1 Tax=Kitasatospora sp. NPDC057692 TaxID=3346215 RepID=UPI00368F1E7A
MTGGDALPEGFLFGASTAAHQIEGNNTTSDWWALEHRPGGFLPEPSGDACDSFHRWPEDMDLLAALGFNAYRFSIEWARIEPVRGRYSRAALAHYRAMVEGALARGLTPVVTLHHFTVPQWFAEAGGWLAPDAAELFAQYAATAAEVLDGVRYVATVNEPNVLARMHTLMGLLADGPAGVDPDRVDPAEEITEALVRAHRAAGAALRGADPRLLVGWTVAALGLHPVEPGAEAVAAAVARRREDVFVEAARGDDWIGVQAYTRTPVGVDGPVPVAEGVRTTIKGWEYYPRALGDAVRRTAALVGPDVPLLVTENGIATADDTERIAYTAEALDGLAGALRDGVDVRGYLHWSLLDNYEWGSYRPTFGLVAVDPRTFARTPKPSAHWLGALAREGRLG